MFNITRSIEIQRPVKDVFALAGDYRNDPRWRQGVLSMTHEPAGPPKLNTVTRETMQIFGQRSVTVAKVVEFTDCSRTAFRSIEGPAACKGFRTFETTSTGTLFTYSLTLDPAGFLSLFSVLIKLVFDKQVQDDLERLKKLLEGATSSENSTLNGQR